MHSLVVDRNAWQTYGAVALRRTGGTFERTETAAPGYDRPWTHHVADKSAGCQQANLQLLRHSPEHRGREEAPEVTPRAEDLDAGD